MSDTQPIDDPSQHRWRLGAHAGHIRSVIVAAKACLMAEQEIVERSDELNAALVLLDRCATEANDLIDEIDGAFAEVSARLRQPDRE